MARKTRLSTGVSAWISFNDSIFFIVISLSFLTHMIIGVCSAKLMESLDSPLKAMACFCICRDYCYCTGIHVHTHTSYDNKEVFVTSEEFFHPRGNIGP